MSSLADLRKTAIMFAIEGIETANPEKAVKKCVKRENEGIKICGLVYPSDYNYYVIGAGKASGEMAIAVENVLREKLVKGIVVVPEEIASKYRSDKICFIGSTHPYPSEKSVYAAERIIDFIKNIEEKAIVLALFSGGGSALIEKPVNNITIDEIAVTSSLLMKAGADIYELNTVRKHLSHIKGGWLAKYVYPKPLVSLLISDVVGDRIDVIASGPTAPDPTSFKDALEILKRYKLEKSIPKSVYEYILGGVKGLYPETPKPTDKIFRKVKNLIIASNIGSLLAMKKKAEEIGYRAIILTSRITGEAREVGKVIAGIASEILMNGNPIQPPAVLLAGGETTVTVKGKGKGGRNQELALSAALMIKDQKNIVVLSIGSDGRDGPTDAAGAIVDNNTVVKAYSLGINPIEYLDNNDSYHFFEKVGGLIKIGYTGTNINDFIIAIVERENHKNGIKN